MINWLGMLGLAPTAMKRKLGQTSAETLLSYERNAHMPCVVKHCGEPRHKNADGDCRSARCTKHHRASQAVHRATFKASMK